MTNQTVTNSKKNITKEPFGLKIAIKKAIEAFHMNKAPQSQIIFNLFELQKSKLFPENLTTDYFFNSLSHSMTPEEKKKTIFLLEEMKKPQINLYDLLYKSISNEWVVKKMQNKINDTKKIIKPIKKNNSITKVKNTKIDILPTIIVKKNKSYEQKDET